MICGECIIYIGELWSRKENVHIKDFAAYHIHPNLTCFILYLIVTHNIK